VANANDKAREKEQQLTQVATTYAGVLRKNEAESKRKLMIYVLILPLVSVGCSFLPNPHLWCTSLHRFLLCQVELQEKHEPVLTERLLILLSP